MLWVLFFLVVAAATTAPQVECRKPAQNYHTTSTTKASSVSPPFYKNDDYYVLSFEAIKEISALKSLLIQQISDIRGGDSASQPAEPVIMTPTTPPLSSTTTTGYAYGGTFPSAGAAAYPNKYSSQQQNQQSYQQYPRKKSWNSTHHKRGKTGNLFQKITEWWQREMAPKSEDFPRFQCRMEPTTTLKIRKTFRPLGTVVQLGADFNTHTGVWQFKSSWEDALIGGKLTLAGRELQFNKSWALSVGGGVMEDLVARVKLRAAIDLSSWKAYARVSFRTEQLAPINILDGFTFQHEFALDGNRGNVKLEVKANFVLPEPEFEYNTESHQSTIRMSDIILNIDEMNLLLDY